MWFKTRQKSEMDKQMVKEEHNKFIEARAQSLLAIQNKSKNESKVGEMKMKVGEKEFLNYIKASILAYQLHSGLNQQHRNNAQNHCRIRYYYLPRCKTCNVSRICGKSDWISL